MRERDRDTRAIVTATFVGCHEKKKERKIEFSFMTCDWWISSTDIPTSTMLVQVYRMER